MALFIRRRGRSAALLCLLIMSFLTAFVSGCTTPRLGPLPQTEEDFKQPPEALRAHFAGVTPTPEGSNRGTLFPEFADIEQAWGSAQHTQPDRASFYGFRGGLSAILLAGTGPTALGAVAAAMPWLVPGQHSIHTYDKGDYTVRVYTVEGFGDTRIADWDWTHHAATGDRDVFATFDAGYHVEWFSQLGGVFGSGWASGDTVARDDAAIKGGLTVSVGAKLPLFSPSNYAALHLGYRDVSIVDDDASHDRHVRDFPLELTFHHVVAPRFAVGVGAAQHFNAKRFSHQESNSLALGDPVGVVLTGDYRIRPRLAVGLRAEHLTFDVSGESSINGNSVAVTLSMPWR